MRPIDIARRLNISTSTLRHYESLGLVPPVPRAANGYRVYTEEHVAYFECIRAMIPGFGIPITREVVRKLQKQEVDEALWLVNEQQALLHREKVLTEKTIRLLETDELDKLEWNRKRKWMTIGEASRETGVPSSSIRHWEREGLLSLPRDPENGYRRLYPSHIRQILMIRILRNADYPIHVIRQVMKELGHNHLENVRKVARDSLVRLNDINRCQMQGVHYLYRLCCLISNW